MSETATHAEAVTLTGLLERITHQNEETGYLIAKIQVRGRKDLVTIVGHILSPTPGEVLTLKGFWSTHPKYGEQFKILEYETRTPASVQGIRKYLGSGLIRGIGPKMAERIVSRFGTETLDVIENRIEQLAGVPGIGEKRIALVRQAWEDQKEIREVMVFLQSHGVSPAFATKIYKQYGADSIAVVRENPYRLAMEIFGIGFLTADRIGEKLGIPRDSPKRAEAGIIYVLHQLSEKGHVFCPFQELLQSCLEILEIDTGTVAEAIERLAQSQMLTIEPNPDQPANREASFVYLQKFHVCESRVAARLKILSLGPVVSRAFDMEEALKWVQQKIGVILAENQKEAVRTAVSQKTMVITGGPGTGKTTIIRAVIGISAALHQKILLAAPTGRAAKRMQEATGCEAQTIHRLLSYSIHEGGFQKNENHPLDADLIIVDEASMIDIVLMYHFLKAVAVSTRLILVGDIDQLPSVGPGSVLSDIIRSGLVSVITLNDIFRQAKNSRIIVNAHRIQRGFLPETTGDAASDFYFIEREDPEKAVDTILQVMTERIPKRFGFDPVDDIQVLSPMNKGTAGVTNLNTVIQQRLNPSGTAILRSGRAFRVRDKVMQIRNNYDRDVFNGDIGRIVAIDLEDQQAIVRFDGRDVAYDFPDMDELVLAYAVSIHKSQGSEYPAVIIPILTQHYVMLQRNLIYTAVTRGKKLVVLVGSKKALAIGIKNDRIAKRYSFLCERLQQMQQSNI
ncbi:SF1B family DNA helicase RecD2 [Desulfatirhabdium butyrativorans]|uniref:SF1B family DNA helicase RecD2 n=1 Tax=Desulfatirhabdium butyrativorans TaxID=340467 RepID=UPI0004062079|nr:ATP-dependent RecD-like DNA helicase [Desulfatirhabdium butyrativorans]